MKYYAIRLKGTQRYWGTISSYFGGFYPDCLIRPEVLDYIKKGIFDFWGNEYTEEMLEVVEFEVTEVVPDKGIKVGTRVKIIGNTAPYDDYDYADGNAYINKSGVVTHIGTRSNDPLPYQIKLDCGDDVWYGECDLEVVKE